MLGDNIRELRKRYHITIEELADTLNSSYSTIAMYETNKRNPDYKMLAKIADYFSVTVDQLLGRIDLDKPIKYLKICKKAESLNVSEEELDSLLDTLIKFKAK